MEVYYLNNDGVLNNVNNIIQFAQFDVVMLLVKLLKAYQSPSLFLNRNHYQANHNIEYTLTFTINVRICYCNTNTFCY